MAGRDDGRGPAVVAGVLLVAVVAVLADPGAVVVRRGGGPAPTIAARAPAADGGVVARPDPVPSGGAQEAPMVGSGGPAGVRVTEVRGGWRLEDGLETAAAVGLLTATAWAAASVTGDHAPTVVLEAVESPGPGAAIVTALMVSVGERGPGTQRVVVPISVTRDGAVRAGTPWVLPGPALAPYRPEAVAVTDPGLVAAARRALDDVGIDGTSLETLEATEGWAYLTRLSGVGDGPWLRWHLDRFVVTGVPLRTAVGMDEGTGGP